ncbi:RHS repeat-associated core domain-containing protein [Oceanibacterium hippocampi]|nr:RHS repeat-associated core domain-containing protein [Oceanibacterium hippocampi]
MTFALAGAGPRAETSQPGAIAAQFSVDDFQGAARYSIPIRVPPATGAIAPSLSLEYSSAGGNGVVGHGWTIGGLDSITRCAASLAINGRKGGVGNDAGDRFCLGGQQLMATSDERPYGAPGDYRTEVESWTHIRSAGDCGGGPCAFHVRLKDGTKKWYGAVFDPARPPTGKLVDGAGKGQAFVIPAIADPGLASVVAEWFLVRVEDRFGNFATVTYGGEKTGTRYPVRVAYDRAGTAGDKARRIVTFTYRIDVAGQNRRIYRGGGVIDIDGILLESIGTALADRPIRRYSLAYQADPAGRAAHYLNRITECAYEIEARDWACLAPTQFRWALGDAGFSSATDYQLPGDLRRYAYFDDAGKYRALLGGTITWLWQKVAGGSGDRLVDFFRRPRAREEGDLIDIDGDGLLDYLPRECDGEACRISYGDGERFVTSGDLFRAQYKAVLGANPWTRKLLGVTVDVDGDGLVDYAEADCGTGQQAPCAWYRNMGRGRGLSPTRSGVLPGRLVRNVIETRRDLPVFANVITPVISARLIDLSGDGRADYLNVECDGDGVACGLYLQRDDGSFDDTPIAFRWGLQGMAPRDGVPSAIIADLNRDGLPDVAEVADCPQAGCGVYAGTGAGFASTPLFTLPGPLFDEHGDIALLADLNGDGNLDWARGHCPDESADCRVLYGTGRGFVDGSQAGQLPEGVFGETEADSPALVDINGDGRLDWVEEDCDIDRNCAVRYGTGLPGEAMFAEETDVRLPGSLLDTAETLSPLLGRNAWALGTYKVGDYLDVDGDGLNDYVNGVCDVAIEDESIPLGDTCDDVEERRAIYRSTLVQPAVVAFRDGLGKEIAVDYQPLSGGEEIHEFDPEDAAPDIVRAAMPLRVVGAWSVRYRDAGGRWRDYRTLRRYRGAKLDRNYGWLGFSEIVQWESETRAGWYRAFSQRYPYIGQTVKEGTLAAPLPVNATGCPEVAGCVAVPGGGTVAPRFFYLRDLTTLSYARLPSTQNPAVREGAVLASETTTNFGEQGRTLSRHLATYTYQANGMTASVARDRIGGPEGDETTRFTSYLNADRFNQGSDTPLQGILDYRTAEAVYPGLVPKPAGTPLRETRITYSFSGQQPKPPVFDVINVLEWQSGEGPSAVYLRTALNLDSWGNVVRVKDPRGLVTTTTYDSDYSAFPVARLFDLGDGRRYMRKDQVDPAHGRMVAEQGFNGEITRIVLDPFGDPADVWGPNLADPASWTTATMATPPGAPLVLLKSKHLKQEKDGRFYWSETQRLDGRVTETRRYIDPLGRVIAEWRMQPTTASDGIWRVEQTAYDGLQRKSGMSLPFAATLSGKPAKAPHWIDLNYDDAGRLETRVYPNGRIERITRQFAYEDGSEYVDLRRRRVNEAGTVEWLKVAEAVYDGFRRKVVERSLPASEPTRMTYDALGRLISRSDPQGGKTSFVYDGRDNVVRRDDATTGLTVEVYDGRGLRRASVRNGETLSFEYDPLGRVTRKSSDRGGGYVYSYDGANGFRYNAPIGRVTGVALPDGNKLTFAYDASGLVSLQRLTLAGDAGSDLFDTIFQRNAGGLVTAITYPDGKKLALSYYGNGARQAMTWDGQTRPVVSYSDYGLFEQAETVSFANGVTEKRPRDMLGRSGGVAVTGASGPIYTESIAFRDELDLPASIREVIAGVSGARTYALSYDGLGRLSGISGSNGGEQGSFAFNGAGAIVSETRGDTTLTYSYDTARPYLLTGRSDGLTLEYDANGNIATRSLGDATRHYVFDVENRMLSTESGGRTATYSYDHNGHRLTRTAPDGTRTIHVGPLYEVTILPDGRQQHTRYVIGDHGRLIAMTESGSGSRQSGAVPPGVRPPHQGPAALEARAALYDPLSMAALRLHATAAMAALATTPGFGPIAFGVFALAVLFWWIGVLRSDAALPGGGAYRHLRHAAPMAIVALVGATVPAPVHAAFSGGSGLPVVGSILHFHKDYLGNVRAVTNQDGALVATMSFDAYGRLESDAGTGGKDVFRPKWAGEEIDGDTGFVQFQARDYDPDIRRFVSPDPAWQSADPYLYALSDPVQFIDPDGRAALPEWTLSPLATGLVATVVGAVAGSLQTLAIGWSGGALGFFANVVGITAYYGLFFGLSFLVQDKVIKPRQPSFWTNAFVTSTLNTVMGAFFLDLATLISGGIPYYAGLEAIDFNNIVYLHNALGGAIGGFVGTLAAFATARLAGGWAGDSRARNAFVSGLGSAMFGLVFNLAAYPTAFAGGALTGYGSFDGIDWTVRMVRGFVAGFFIGRVTFFTPCMPRCAFLPSVQPTDQTPFLHFSSDDEPLDLGSSQRVSSRSLGIEIQPDYGTSNPNLGPYQLLDESSDLTVTLPGEMGLGGDDPKLSDSP